MKSDKSKYYDITYRQKSKKYYKWSCKTETDTETKNKTKQNLMVTKEEKGRNKLGVCD